MISKPTISVIINCYNGQRFLKEAIDSVYSQTFEDWEIIFWDNCSTDKSKEIALSYDKKVKIFSSQITTPLGEARNFALQEASGKYLTFLDCDDLFISNKLEEQLSVFLASEQELGFVYGMCEFFVSDQNIKRKVGFSHEGLELKCGDIFSDLCKENFIPWPSVLIDREKLLSCGDIPNNFKNSVDYWVFMQLSRRYKVGVINSVVSKARGHLDNLAHGQYSLAARENIEIVSEFLPDKMAQSGIKYHGVNLFIGYIKEKDYRNAIKTIFNLGGWRLLLHRMVRKIVAPIIKIDLDLTIYD